MPTTNESKLIRNMRTIYYNEFLLTFLCTGFSLYELGIGAHHTWHIITGFVLAIFCLLVGLKLKKERQKFINIVNS